MACCTGCSAGVLGSFFCAAYHAGNPSSVVIDLAATVETGVRQERVSTPLTKTEHDPHCPRPQPNLGPCRFSSFDSTYNSGVSGQVPRTEPARKQWLGEQVRVRLHKQADRFRQVLIRNYGADEGRRIEYAEAFEACEYGAPLDAAARRRLFPFVPKP